MGTMQRTAREKKRKLMSIFNAMTSKREFFVDPLAFIFSMAMNKKQCMIYRTSRALCCYKVERSRSFCTQFCRCGREAILLKERA